MNYTITNDTVMAIVDGHPVTVRKGAPNFAPLRDALLAGDEAKVRANLTVANSLESWAQGRFTVEGTQVKFDGEPLPEVINRRVVDMAAKGESPEPVFKFWENLKQNSSYRSVQQLYTFLQHCGIPLTDDGCFLAYKGVTEDLKDCHSRTIDNTPGQTVKMDRNKISDDPNEACHYGLHVGALGYAKDFGPRCIIVKVNPRDVVCVPYDASAQKMRVCEYTVQGHYAGKLDDTSHSDENDPVFMEGVEGFDDEGEGCEGPYGTTIVGDDGQGPAADKKPEPIKVTKQWAKIHAMDTIELFKQPIEKLRRYAGKCLHIVGASKLRGGKTALVGRINQVRNNLPTEKDGGE